MRNNPAQLELAAALRERLVIINDEPSRQQLAQHLERLRQVSARIARVEQQLPRPIDPLLAHYLAKASYTKALEFLEGTSAGEADAL